tara:strand:- start:32 stop:421 length:390 start_codon:yes stop_codon:yes gene_type:complete
MNKFNTWKDFSKGLESEINHFMGIRDDEPDQKDDTNGDVLYHVIQLANEKGQICYNFRREVDNFLIAIGALEKVTQDTYDHTFIFGGTKLDKRQSFCFRNKGQDIYDRTIDWKVIYDWADNADKLQENK